MSTSSTFPTEESAWVDAFEKHLRKKSFEQFKLLLCELPSASPQQRQLLGNILFVDANNASFWSDYVNYVCEQFHDRKLHLQRVVNKALEILDESQHKHENAFLAIHLQSIKLKSTHEEMLRYFQNVLWKKDIGKTHADLYIAWADIEKETNAGLTAALQTLQKGLDYNAMPQEALLQKMEEWKNPKPVVVAVTAPVEPVVVQSAPVATPAKTTTKSAEMKTSSKSSTSTRAKKESNSKTLALFDDGEVQFNKKIKTTALTPSSSTTLSSDSIDDDDEPTQTQKLPIKPDSARKETIKATPISSALKRLKPNPSGMLGKCQRVTTPVAAAPILEEEFPMDVVEEKPVVELASTSSKKADLSKYIDDKIRNFNPQAKPQPAINEAAPAITRTITAPSSSSSQKKLPFSILDTNLENNNKPVSTPNVMPTMEEKSEAPVVAKAAATSVKKRKFGDVISTETNSVKSAKSPEIIMKNQQHKSTSDSPTSNTTDLSFDAATMKIPTEDVKELFAAIPVEPVKIVPGSGSKSSASKRNRRVSFNAQQEDEQSKSNKTTTVVDTSQVVAVGAGMFQDANRYLTLNEKSFVSLQLIGKGGSSAVHRVISCQDGSLYALKRVEVKDNEDFEQVFESYANEINLLKSLKGTSPYIIDMVDFDVSKENKLISMLLEAGDIDLAKLLNQKIKLQQQVAASGQIVTSALDPIFARMIWKEMLLAVHHIHEHRIVHGDLKPANFVFVKGHLKLIDFGIAKSFSSDTTNIYRDSQIGTVNYMAPEAIAPSPESICRDKDSNTYSMKLGRASDIWSLGCILYQIIYTRPPFAALNTIQKLTAIPNPKFEISYPEHHDVDAIESIKACLIRSPKDRSPIMGQQGLIQMKYLEIPSSTAALSSHNEASIAVSSAVEQRHHVAPSEGASLTMVNDILKAVRTQLPSRSNSILDNVDVKSVLRELQSQHHEQHGHHTGDSIRSEASSTVTQEKTAAADKENQHDAGSRHSLRSASKQIHAASSSSSSSSSAMKKTRTTTEGVAKALFTKMKSPLKSIPINLREEIKTDRSKLVPLQSEEGVARANKWMKQQVSESNDLKNVLERRMNQLRYFLDDDQDNVTATESIDMSFSIM